MVNKEKHFAQILLLFAIAVFMFSSTTANAEYGFEISRTAQAFGVDNYVDHCLGGPPGPKDIVVLCDGFHGDGISLRVVKEHTPNMQLSTRVIYLKGVNAPEKISMKNTHFLIGISKEIIAGFRLGLDIGVSSFVRESDTLFFDKQKISYSYGFYAERPTKLINNIGFNLRVGMLYTQVNDFYKGKKTVSGVGFDAGVIF